MATDRAVLEVKWLVINVKHTFLYIPVVRMKGIVQPSLLTMLRLLQDYVFTDRHFLQKASYTMRSKFDMRSSKNIYMHVMLIQHVMKRMFALKAYVECCVRVKNLERQLD